MNMMSQKSEMINAGLLAALVAFAAIATFAAVMSLGSETSTSAYALRDPHVPDKYFGYNSASPGAGAGIECDCPGIA
jgi:hypothetical protein